MDKFIGGLKLGELFFFQCIKPILDKYFPELKYSAGIIGWGSEVIGFDTQMSSDHHWGPRAIMFLKKDDYNNIRKDIDETLSRNLPYDFMGYTTNYSGEIGSIRLPQPISSGTVKHLIEFYTIESFFEMYLGINPFNNIDNLDWLTFEEHKLLGITSGKVFYDDLGLNKVRSKFNYYPEDIWLYLLASQWKKISQEEAFVGRCGDVGDELGSQIIASRLVRELMYLAFLMEKVYAPYSKWFGSAFSKLKCAKDLVPAFNEVLSSRNWKEREKGLCKAYVYMANLHNTLIITKWIEPSVSNYYDRPYMVILAERFAKEIIKEVRDNELKNNSIIGSVNQFIYSTDVLTNPDLCNKLKDIYK